jgi:uncharacterized protein (DUF1499 family)
LSLVILLAVAVVSCVNPSKQTGIADGRLRPCPGSPNCVCSQDVGRDSSIDPLTFTGSSAKALDRLKNAVLAMPRTRLVDEGPGYLRFEFRSAVFRFTDDVEFLFDGDNPVIQVRSASRVGYSDLGVNRRRIEAIRLKFGG